MSKYTSRRIKNLVMMTLAYLALVIAMIPLASIIIETIARGSSAINLNFITQETPPLGQAGGGIGPAIEGTLIIVGLASLWAVPIGVFSGIYVAEFRDNFVARTARFMNDVLSGMPSIVLGIFAWIVVVLVVGWSVIAGAFALGIMMIPIVSRTTEEAIKLVPGTIREAALALGVPRWKTTLTVVMSSSKRGIATGILLAIARITGETAPLLLTILGSRFWFGGLTEPSAALTLSVFDLSQSPFLSVDLPRAWGASLILMMIILGIYIVVRYLTREKYGR
jgi:phosphate transport system permease protein